MEIQPWVNNEQYIKIRLLIAVKRKYSQFKVLLTRVVIYPYHMKQQDALFSFNLFQ